MSVDRTVAIDALEKMVKEAEERREELQTEKLLADRALVTHEEFLADLRSDLAKMKQRREDEAKK